MARPPALADGPLLSARGLSKTYVQRRWGGESRTVTAVDGVDLDLEAGSITAVVGESGSGKSTLARCLTLLERPDAGSILLRGEDLLALRGGRLAAARRACQLIFQDAAEALNPRFNALQIVEEPLVIAGEGDRATRRLRARAMLERIGLPAGAADRRPADFSGGERQRLVVARALVVEPDLLVLDESFAGQDLSIRARIVNMLLDLRDETGLTQLFISHDLSLVRQLADRVAVLYRGRFIEAGPPDELHARARHPHTRALIEATPMLEPEPGSKRPLGAPATAE